MTQNTASSFREKCRAGACGGWGKTVLVAPRNRTGKMTRFYSFRLNNNTWRRKGLLNHHPSRIIRPKTVSRMVFSLVFFNEKRTPPPFFFSFLFFFFNIFLFDVVRLCIYAYNSPDSRMCDGARLCQICLGKKRQMQYIPGGDKPSTPCHQTLIDTACFSSRCINPD